MTDREAFDKFLTFPREIIEPWMVYGYEYCDGVGWKRRDRWVQDSHDPDDLHIRALAGCLCSWMVHTPYWIEYVPGRDDPYIAANGDDLSANFACDTFLAALVAAFEEVEVGR
jgi:hypothetical protein